MEVVHLAESCCLSGTDLQVSHCLCAASAVLCIRIVATTCSWFLAGQSNCSSTLSAREGVVTAAASWHKGSGLGSSTGLSAWRLSVFYPAGTSSEVLHDQQSIPLLPPPPSSGCSRSPLTRDSLCFFLPLEI